MIEAKGRNGYFRVGQVEVWKKAPGEHETMHVDIYSTRPGKNPPARIQGKPGEIIKLLMDMFVKATALRMGGENFQNIMVQEKGEKENA